MTGKIEQFSNTLVYSLSLNATLYHVPVIFLENEKNKDKNFHRYGVREEKSFGERERLRIL